VHLRAVGPASLHRTSAGFTTHYHGKRNHQGLVGTLIWAEPTDAVNDAFIHRRQWLGEMLNDYYRIAV
jgi:hypothetical protein